LKHPQTPCTDTSVTKSTVRHKPAFDPDHQMVELGTFGALGVSPSTAAAG
jgi:hypothetical protein